MIYIDNLVNNSFLFSLNLLLNSKIMQKGAKPGESKRPKVRKQI
jgi:hypothetical protein